MKAATSRRPGLSDADKTEALRWALHRKYPAERYAVVEEVPKSAGFTMGYCDAMVLELWPSDGHRLLGFELKASRADWKRDLGRDTKHRQHIERCDRYTLLTYGTAVARREEIPAGWGWWSVTDDGTIEVIVKGRRLVGRRQWEKGFVAVLVRRAIEGSPSAGLLAAVADQARRQARAEGQSEYRRLQSRIQHLERLTREAHATQL